MATHIYPNLAAHLGGCGAASLRATDLQEEAAHLYRMSRAYREAATSPHAWKRGDELAQAEAMQSLAAAVSASARYWQDFALGMVTS